MGERKTKDTMVSGGEVMTQKTLPGFAYDRRNANEAALTLLMIRLEKKEGVFSRCVWKLSAIRASGPTEK